MTAREGRPYWASVAGLVMLGSRADSDRRSGGAPPPSCLTDSGAGTDRVVTLSAAAFYGLVRFRAPAEISIVVLAAVALDAALAPEPAPGQLPRTPDRRRPPA
jgi:hypothetical protein